MIDIDREFVGLASPIVGRAGAGGHPCQGIWHTPRGQRPKVGFIATHYNVDFPEHYLASYLVERGFGFLGWNTRFRGMERAFLLDHAVAEIGVGVRWMKEVAGVETVVIVGNSGGGSLMGAYQSQAVEANIAPTWDLPTLDCIDDLIAGDLYVFVAAPSGPARDLRQLVGCVGDRRERPNRNRPRTRHATFRQCDYHQNRQDGASDYGSVYAPLSCTAVT